MDKITNKRIIKELKKLKKKLKEINLNKMIMFGSRARNEELEYSDVDVIVVSKDFENLKFKQRPNKFLDSWKYPIDLEIICYTPEEFEIKKNQIGIVQQAVKEGIEIK